MNRIDKQPSDPVHRDPRIIQQEIEDTRNGLDSTMDQLGEKLNPTAAIREASDWARSKVDEFDQKAFQESCARSGERVVAKAKDNSLPLALAGVAAASYFFNKWYRQNKVTNLEDIPEPSIGTMSENEHGSSNLVSATGEPLPTKTDPWAAKHRTSENGNSSNGSNGSRSQELKESLSDASQKVSEIAKSTGEKAKLAVDDARIKASAYAATSKTAISDVSQRAYQSTRNGAKASSDAVKTGAQEHPFIAAAIAMTAGLVAAAFLPGTRKEDELCGAEADELKSKLADKSSEIRTRVEEKLSDAKLDAEGIQERVESRSEELQEKLDNEVAS
ncbi:MAG: DUF3618 domain-containing protein [Verrucomicrobiales bacterium]|nr:DUF3618 domain-containing protein [Verrucomicrobiales bacterium]